MENVEASGAQFGVLGIETDVLYQWRTLVPTYETRITSIHDIHVRNIKIGETATPFRILGDARQPVKDVFLDNITIGTVRGQKHHYENASNVKEANIHIGKLIEEAEKENTNR
jgi:hypothetical protein